MQDLRILIGGVVMLFVSAFLMAEHSQAASQQVSLANEAPANSDARNQIA